jgi:hypothetical protein
MEGSQCLNWCAFLKSISRDSREKHIASRSVFSSGQPDYIFKSNLSVMAFGHAFNSVQIPPRPPLAKGGNVLLSVTRVTDNLY